jgi:hypothetical protein
MADRAIRNIASASINPGLVRQTRLKNLGRFPSAAIRSFHVIGLSECVGFFII